MVGFTSRRLGIVHLFVGTGLDRLSLFILGQEPMGFMSVERAAYQKPRLRRLLFGRRPADVDVPLCGTSTSAGANGVYLVSSRCVVVWS